MPLSTSNSSNKFSRSYMGLAFAIGIVVGSAILLTMEMRLRVLGIEPNVRDSPELWAAQREMAAKLGDQAIIIVGDSRGQLDIDLQTLKVATSLMPVQLAIDGSYFLPVLADLADDERITGTIVVDASVMKLVPNNIRDRSVEWTEFYHGKYRGLLSPAVETRLKGLLQEKSALYSSMFPLDKLWGVLTSKQKFYPQYLKTRNNRQRDADYRMVAMPNFYISRVIRHFGGEKRLNKKSFRTFAEFDSSLREQIEESPSVNARLNMTDEQLIKDYEAKLSYVHDLTRKLQDRNAKIFFVRFPSDKLVWMIDEHSRPRKLYWDTFARTTSAKAIHFRDYPDLRNYTLPDGSHLDQRDKKNFSSGLIAALNLHR